MESVDDISNSFRIESKKLYSAINDALTKPYLDLSEIIPLYFQTANTLSLIAIIKQQIKNDNNSPIVSEIKETENMISEKFNSKLHKSIMLQLANSIAETTKKLSSESTSSRSQEEIQKEATIFEKLRQTMSTKEFVEQYDKGISYD